MAFPSNSPVLSVRLPPQSHLERHCLEPSVIHVIHRFRRVALLRKKVADGDRDRHDKGDQVAEGDQGGGRGHMVGLILLGAMVAQTDLVLVVQPVLIVLSSTGVQDPLVESLQHRSQIFGNRLTLRI